MYFQVCLQYTRMKVLKGLPYEIFKSMFFMKQLFLFLCLTGNSEFLNFCLHYFLARLSLSQKTEWQGVGVFERKKLKMTPRFMKQQVASIAMGSLYTLPHCWQSTPRWRIHQGVILSFFQNVKSLSLPSIKRVSLIFNITTQWNWFHIPCWLIRQRVNFEFLNLPKIFKTKTLWESFLGPGEAVWWGKTEVTNYYETVP